MGLYWYVAPVCDIEDCPTGGYHPGATDACPGIIPGLARIHCYDAPEEDEEPTVTCLVGSEAEKDYTGWTEKTVAEAEVIFEAYYERAPTEGEVY